MCHSYWSVGTSLPQHRIDDIVAPIITALNRLGAQAMPVYERQSLDTRRPLSSGMGGVEVILPTAHAALAERLRGYCTDNPLFELVDRSDEIPGWYVINGIMSSGCTEFALRQHWGEVEEVIQEYCARLPMHRHRPR